MALSLRSEAQAIVDAALAYDPIKGGEVGPDVRIEPRDDGQRLVVVDKGTKVVSSPNQFYLSSRSGRFAVCISAKPDPTDKKLVFSTPEVVGPFGIKLKGGAADAVAKSALRSVSLRLKAGS
jgi:hypothetical protein